MDPRLQKRLRERVIPRLQRLQDRYFRWQHWSTICLLAPVSVALFLLIIYLLRQNDAFVLTFFTSTAGLCGVFFVWRGRLEACVASIDIIMIAIEEGNFERFNRAFANLACPGKMGGILDDIRSVTKTD